MGKRKVKEQVYLKSFLAGTDKRKNYKTQYTP